MIESISQPDWSLARHVQEASMLELVKWAKHAVLPSVGLIQSNGMKMQRRGELIPWLTTCIVTSSPVLRISYSPGMCKSML